MFCHITGNWRGKPLTSVEVIVSLIGATTTREGLRLKAVLDRHEYPKGRRATDAEMAALSLERDERNGDWNYSLRARTRR